MLRTVVLLLAAVVLLVAALVTGHIALSWGSVAVSAVVAVMIIVRWRRRRDEPAVELVDAVPGEPSPQLASARQADPVSASAASAGADDDAEPAEPGEEETDAADLLVVYELADEVLVVDEHPRYHLTRCPVADRARAERLPVREARELGFTPCGRCRPDIALARKHRAARAATGGS
ncbi:MAG: hypothetical protein ACRDRP_12565 [Pseudonocardiaceae bacterium]